MRAVVQRVSQAGVTVDGEQVARINTGLLVFLGVDSGDNEAQADYLAEKIVGLRIFEDAALKMNYSVKDIAGELLVVSQFTLLADCRKGRRPGFSKAARPELAEPLCEYFVERLQQLGMSVQTGRFRAEMEVTLINNGPVTIILDSYCQF